ncbi:MAG: M36 family metallopeptidase, partial [Candidatus Promineifilaceae bacterium]
GGSGSDSVNADALDGSGVNNANFGTPPDGANPRMQMYRATYPFGQAVTVTAPITLTGTYTANPSNNGGEAMGLSGDIELVVDGTAPNDDACETVTNDLTGKIALIVWSGGLCNSSVFVLNAANAGAIAAIIVDNTPLPLTNFGGNAAIPSVAIGSDDGQAFIDALNNNTVTGSIGHNPIPGYDRDTDMDAGVMAHEYGHGISNRLTGGPSTASCLGNAEQMGEGWSDLQTLMIHAHSGDTSTTPRETGVWSLGAGIAGIRTYPYTTDMGVNPHTYDAIKTNTEVHYVGEVWASIVWEAYWNMVDAHGFNPNIYDDWTTGGNNLMYQLMTDGMKLQPCLPGFVDGRDGILAADMALTGGANQCALWEGFAKRGLGYSADEGSPFSATDGTEAFDLPPACGGPGIVIEKSPATQNVTTGGNANFTISVTNTGGVDLSNVNVSDPLVPACDNAIGSLAISATVSYGCSDIGVTASYTNVVTVTSQLATGAPGPSATASAMVTVSDPTDVSLTGFGSGEQQGSVIVLIATLFAVVIGFSLVLIRRKVDQS